MRESFLEVIKELQQMQIKYISLGYQFEVHCVPRVKEFAICFGVFEYKGIRRSSDYIYERGTSKAREKSLRDFKLLIELFISLDK